MPTPEADHGHHLGGEGRGGDHVGQQVEHGEGDGDAEQGGDDGQAHGHHRAEGQQHDDDGGQDPDALAGARASPRPPG